MPKPPAWSLVIHGGCGQFRRDSHHAQAETFRTGLTAALAAGAEVLRGGGTALDAVEAAVCCLEDDPAFNAGRGAVLDADGGIALDAAIMDGRTRAAGAVAGVTRTRHPVSLARAVMARTPHVLLAGPGADRFAATTGLEQVPPDWFEVPERRRQLERVLADGGSFDAEVRYGTVGAVARDAAGHVAAATSTGGLTAKRWGRIGDTPLIGAGTLADDRAGAVSATGSGEHFIRIGAAHELLARVRLIPEPPQAAARAVIADLGRIGGSGGVIFVGADGSCGWAFNTAGMLRGCVTADQNPQVAVFADEG